MTNIIIIIIIIIIGIIIYLSWARVVDGSDDDRSLSTNCESEFFARVLSYQRGWPWRCPVVSGWEYWQTTLQQATEQISDTIHYIHKIAYIKHIT